MKARYINNVDILHTLIA